jgi:hypothetical protein
VSADDIRAKAVKWLAVAETALATATWFVDLDDAAATIELRLRARELRMRAEAQVVDPDATVTLPAVRLP